jgi:hypothetical protein
MKPIVKMHPSVFKGKKPAKPSQLDTIISNLERDIIYGRLEAQTCEKETLKYWAGYLLHAKEFLKEVQTLKK